MAIDVSELPPPSREDDPGEAAPRFRAGEVHGIDLATIAGSSLLELRRIVCEYEVVVVRGQSLDAAAQSRFSRRLGPSAETPFVTTLSGHPDVIRVVKEADEGDAFNFGGAWHSDFSFLERPPSFTILAAVDVPPSGGDTLFASMTRAWDALPDETRSLLRVLDGVHTARDAYSQRMQPLHSGMRGMEIVCDDTADATRRHPLVTTHPETGRAVLFYNRAYVRDLVGAPESDVAGLLAFLHDHTTDDRFVYRHTWRPGDVVIWDNRSVQHNALNDYAGHRREMHRTTVVGDRPGR